AFFPCGGLVAAFEEATTFAVGSELVGEAVLGGVFPGLPEQVGGGAVARAEAQQAGLGLDRQELGEEFGDVLVVDALGVALGVAGLHEGLDGGEEVGGRRSDVGC